MPLARVATRYAKSLIDLAEEMKALKDVEIDMNLFHATCESSRELRIFLANPIINHDKKLVILNRLFSNVHKITKSFFNILSRKGREVLLYDISIAFENQLRIKRGISRANLTTAVKLTKEQTVSLTKILAESVGAKIELEERIDEDLIGGFVLKVGDKQIDSSVKTELNRIKNKFSDTTYINKL